MYKIRRWTKITAFLSCFNSHRNPGPMGCFLILRSAHLVRSMVSFSFVCRRSDVLLCLFCFVFCFFSGGGCTLTCFACLLAVRPSSLSFRFRYDLISVSPHPVCSTRLFFFVLFFLTWLPLRLVCVLTLRRGTAAHIGQIIDAHLMIYIFQSVWIRDLYVSSSNVFGWEPY